MSAADLTRTDIAEWLTIRDVRSAAIASSDMDAKKSSRSGLQGRWLMAKTLAPSVQAVMSGERFDHFLTIPEFPLPAMARALSPNGRAHWTVKRRARLYVAEHIKVYASASRLPRMEGKVTMYPHFTFPNHRSRDDDNLATGVLKAVRDCLVNGGWLEADDMDHLRQMPVEITVERGKRLMSLRFEVLK